MRGRRALAATALAALGLRLAGAVPATAHVTADPNEARPPLFKTSFRVGHGCAGAPTTAVRVQLPEGLTSVRPQPVPSWEIEITRDELPERTAEVAWVGGELPDDWHEEFGLSMRLPDDPPDVLYFPIVQECAEGVHRWIEVPDSLEGWDDLEEPAPYVLVALEAEQGAPATDRDLVPWAALALAAVAVVLGAAALVRGASSAR